MFTKTDLCFIKEDDVHGYSTGISLSKAELCMRMSTSWVSAFLMENRVMVNRRRGHRLRNEVVSRCGWLGSIHQLFYQPDRNTAGCLLIPRVIYTYSQTHTHTHTPFLKPTKNRPESQRGAHIHRTRLPHNYSPVFLIVLCRNQLLFHIIKVGKLLFFIMYYFETQQTPSQKL